MNFSERLTQYRLTIFFLAFVSLPLLPTGGSAIADTCVQERANNAIACTGNDVRVTFADNIRDIFGAPLLECAQGHSFSFIADFHLRTTATARYDVGIYLAIDGDPNGDGAASGVCSSHIIEDRHLDPKFPNAVMLGSAVAANLDGDVCRDINSAHGWRNIAGKIVTLRINDAVCNDRDGDGNVNLPNCISWATAAGVSCNSSENTVPTLSSHCSCDVEFNVPVVVAPGSNQVTENDQQLSIAPRIRPVLLSESAAPQQEDPN